LKSHLIPEFFRAFAKNMNYDYDNKFLYDDTIGQAKSRPIGTIYEDSSFAKLIQNTLFVTINIFYQSSPTETIGELGTIAGTVNGAHLEWFENVLAEGNKLDKVKHIFVQGHFPVMYPVRKTKSSGLYMEDHTSSDFWKAMQKHNVDIYFAGESHLNTVSQDSTSDLIQVVSRGNFFSNVLTVDVTDDTIDVTCHEEYGEEKTMQNFQYRTSGNLKIRKNGNMKTFHSSGELAFLDKSFPVMHFDFEVLSALKDRPVLGLGEMKGVRRSPTIETVTVRGIECDQALHNTGHFGQDYDAQVSNISLSQGIHNLAGKFDTHSRAAIWGIGPHALGNKVSYSIWFKTTSVDSMFLITYESYWTKHTFMNLMLNNGIPELSYSESQKLSVMSDRLNDGEWHHLAVSVPKKDCLLADIEFYVGGEQKSTSLMGADSTISFPSGGVLALGGLGYGELGAKLKRSRKGFQIGSPYVGEIDDVFVWARDLNISEVDRLARKPFDFAIRSKLSYEWEEALCIGLGMFLDSISLRPCNDEKSQRWTFDSMGYLHNKKMYEKCLVPESSNDKISLKDCEQSSQYDFRWKVNNERSIEYVGMGSTGKVLTVVNEGTGNDIELHPFQSSSLNQSWELVERHDPSYLTKFPSSMPSNSPTKIPTTAPSKSPTKLPSVSPSMLPTEQPSPTPTQQPSNMPSITQSMNPSSSCRDTKGKFVMKDGSTKSCSRAKVKPSLCDINKVFKKCPLTCGSCTPINECEDMEGRFEIGNDKKRSCRAAASNPSLCENPVVNENCCKTCPQVREDIVSNTTKPW
jgi:hypothetical protein